MKYIMIDYSIPIIFTEAHQHSQFVGGGTITSAGFFKIVPVDDGIGGTKLVVETYGFSVSLKIYPDPIDAEVLEKHLFDKEVARDPLMDVEWLKEYVKNKPLTV